MGLLMWRQEFNSEFIVSEGAFFGAVGIKNFEAQEEWDLTDLELKDMEQLVQTNIPDPTPTVDDMRAAMDSALRIRQLIYA